MKIAVHETGGSSFSKRWIEYFEANSIPYKKVNCYSNDIIEQLNDCDALMWHFHHAHPADCLFAKQLIYSVQAAGKKVFPDFNTMWHFDDKVGQKYLLEAVGASLVQCYVFYSKKEAIDWALNTSYPKVFKLRGGAGSVNVKLIRNYPSARKLINRAFGAGFRHDSEFSPSDILNKFRNKRASFKQLLQAIAHRIIASEYSKVHGRERGYIYFQDFIPNNVSDTRIIVVGEKAFAIKRMVRENDFRASGSGKILYAKNEIDERCVKIAFETSSKLNSQCMTYDFVFKDTDPYLIEISFGFFTQGYYPCEGYWDKNLNWFPGSINPQAWMVELILYKAIL